MDPLEIKVETPLTQYLFSKASRVTVPLSGTFELSPVCNFQCRMCYVRKTSEEVKQHIRPILKLEQWLQIAKEARDAGMLYLLLTGGEPFLWPDFWELYEELSKMGFLISINTNGSLINEEAIERLKRMPPTRVNITLYGAGDDSYEALCGAKHVFTKVDKAITELQKAGITVKLNGSLTPENVHDLEKCTKYAMEHGLIYEPNTYMYPPVRRDASMVGQNERFTPKEAAYYRLKSYQLQYGDTLYHQYLRSIQKGFVPPLGLDESCVDPRDGRIRCRAGKASFWITWDGYMTPCGMMTQPQIDMTDCSFHKAWDDLVRMSKEIKLSGTCDKCENRRLCHSCAAMAMAETGKAEEVPKYLCKMITEMKHFADIELKE